MHSSTRIPPEGGKLKILKVLEVLDFLYLFIMGCLSSALLEVGKGLEMILVHIASTCLNMSSLGAIWTRLKQK